VALEKASVVTAAEEAGLLALRASGRRKSRPGGFLACFRLRLRTEWEADARERGGRERREHVGLVLSCVGTPSDEERPVALDNARVVPRPERFGTSARDEREQLVEAKCAVAANAGIRRLPRLVALGERLDDGSTELLAQVERDVRQTERMAGIASGGDCGRRAARSLGVRSRRVLPQAQGHADRVRGGAQKRHRAVHAAAHRDDGSTGRRRGDEHLSQGGCERFDRERFSRDRGRLEQRHSRDHAIEARCVSLDDDVSTHAETN